MPRLPALLLSSAAFAGALLHTDAASAQSTPARQLESVRRAIESTQSEIEQKQSTRRKIADTIQATQSQLSANERELTQLNSEHRRTWQQLNELQQNLTALQAKTQAARAQIAQLLNTRYTNRQPDPLVLLMQNTDPNTKARQLNYIRYIQAANKKVMTDLAAQQQELKQQETRIQAQLAKLSRIRTRQTQLVAALKNRKAAAVQENALLNQDIAAQTDKLKTLQENEKRLTGVIAAISRQAAQRQKARRLAAAAARAQTRRATAKPTPSGNAGNNRLSGSDSALTQEDLALKPESGSAETAPVATSSFVRLQGQLRLPVSGSLQGRFGTAKPGGGIWHGVFIATAAQSVAAVAAGEVAYAGPLEGYGNVVILDHDGQYLSLYTGLSSISVSKGSHIGTRTRLGTSGSVNGVPGLYFEIRNRTVPVNPLIWV